MKLPILLTGFLILISTLTIVAQPPEQFTYQAVVRDSNNFIIRNTTIGLRLSILKDSSTSTTPLYSEIHTLSTNSNGLITTEIGGGTVQSGDFSTIMWGDGIYFIKTDIDVDGGSDYEISGVTRVLSVPYALHAKRAMYSDSSAISGYSDTSHFSNYSDSSVVSDFSDSTRIAGTSESSLFSNYADSSRISVYSDSTRVSLSSYTSEYSTLSDSARVAGFSQSSLTSTFSDSSRITNYSDSARVSIQSDSSIVSIRSNYSDSARVARLLPHMTTTQRDSIQNPPEGLQIYNLTTHCLELNMGPPTSPEWFQIGCLGTVDSIICSTSIISQGISYKTPSDGGTVTIPYTDGNSYDFPQKVFQSQGVSGLTLSLLKGRVNSGDGNIHMEFSGTPQDTGTAIFLINVATKSCSLEVYVDVPLVDSLLCDEPTISKQIVEGDSLNSISIQLSYLGGSGRYFYGDTIESTQVIGMKAVIDSGYIGIGDDSIQINLGGVPMGNGIGYFPIVIGGQTCSIGIYVIDSSTASYTDGYFHCDPLNPTEVVEVLNPSTNKIWMDRNLGALRVATSFNDAQAYGDWFQWGRFADGHQCRESDTTSTLSSTPTPGDSIFIVNSSSPFNWLSTPDDNLWQGANGMNNPCPSGYRLPTEAEWETERKSWEISNLDGAFASPLKLPVSGGRNNSSGEPFVVGTYGFYWSSSFSGTKARILYFYGIDAVMFSINRATGYSVRCIKD